VKKAARFIVLMGLVLGVVVAVPQLVSASSREVLLEDLPSPERLGQVEDDIHHRAERPGKVVRVVPWFEQDGSYKVLVITEAGWVYESGADPSQWTLVGRVLEGVGPR
jgi:hypothetical protein